jgi:hypothetical protein
MVAVEIADMPAGNPSGANQHDDKRNSAHLQNSLPEDATVQDLPNCVQRGGWVSARIHDFSRPDRESGRYAEEEVVDRGGCCLEIEGVRVEVELNELFRV